VVADDLYSVLTKLGENITMDEIHEMIRQIDINSDGKIDYEEFVLLMTGKPAKNKKEK
jgi:calmodulin